jgi:hypothetical protein
MRILASPARQLAVHANIAVLVVAASSPEEGMMKSIRVIRRPWQVWTRTARIAAALSATAVPALPAAAFGASPASTVAVGSSTARSSGLSRSTNAQAALAFARCMRSHGVANFPDPNGAGVFPKRTPQQLGVSGSQFDAAQRACSHLLPSGGLAPGAAPTQAELRTMERDALKFARCMRSHGVANWPDFTLRGGIPIFDLHGTSIAPNSPQIVAKQQGCKSLLHLSNSPPTSGGSA